jgi:hypothetical protein
VGSEALIWSEQSTPHAKLPGVSTFSVFIIDKNKNNKNKIINKSKFSDFPYHAQRTVLHTVTLFRRCRSSKLVRFYVDTLHINIGVTSLLFLLYSVAQRQVHI